MFFWGGTKYETKLGRPIAAAMLHPSRPRSHSTFFCMDVEDVPGAIQAALHRAGRPFWEVCPKRWATKLDIISWMASPTDYGGWGVRQSVSGLVVPEP